MTECEWCEQVWPALVRQARSGQTINYQSLKDAVGFNGWQRTFSHCLGRIANLCHCEGWPIITVMVVNKATGVPGAGIPFVDDFDVELERVRAFPWQDHAAPVAEQFPESACLTS
jgi:hypothetical protein